MNYMLIVHGRRCLVQAKLIPEESQLISVEKIMKTKFL